MLHVCGITETVGSCAMNKVDSEELDLNASCEVSVMRILVT